MRVAGTGQCVRAQPTSVSPTYPRPSRTPGGTAKIAEPVCWRYSPTCGRLAPAGSASARTGMRVAHEREEEQAGVEPAEAVAAVGEVVAAAQHPARRRSRRDGRGATCESSGDERRRRCPATSKSGCGELVAARQRRTLALGAADDRLLLRAATCGPTSRCACGSGARPGTCRRSSSRRRRRRRLHPHVLVERVGVLGLEVRGAVLEAEQVARGRLVGRRRRRPAEAELRPAQRRRCRSRCGPGCGWRARRPAGRWRRPGRRGRRRERGRVERRRRGSAGRSISAGRAAVGEAEAVRAVGGRRTATGRTRT